MQLQNGYTPIIAFAPLLSLPAVAEAAIVVNPDATFLSVRITRILRSDRCRHPSTFLRGQGRPFRQGLMLRRHRLSRNSQRFQCFLFSIRAWHDQRVQ